MRHLYCLNDTSRDFLRKRGGVRLVFHVYISRHCPKKLFGFSNMYKKGQGMEMDGNQARLSSAYFNHLNHYLCMPLKNG